MKANDQQLLEQLNAKVDLLLTCFGLNGKSRMTPRERNEIVEKTLLRFEARKKLKTLPKNG